MPTKGVEYLLVLGYLALFIPFWRLFFAGRGEPVLARASAGASASVRIARRLPPLPMEDMFRVPDGVWFHPGHVWARPNGPGAAAVGIDDFAGQLMGPLVGVLLPEVGSHVTQGLPAITLKADSAQVDVLSPVTGRVRALNPAAIAAPSGIHADPYGRGWLFEVESPRLDVDSRQLLSGTTARQWMASSWEELSSMLSPQLGTIMHDGGVPVDGFARAIDREHWDRIARRFLRT